MSETAIGLIKAYYDAFNAADAPGLLALLADDVRHDINQGRSETGRDAFAEFLAEMMRCYRETVSALVLFADAAGERAAAEYVVHGSYLESAPALPPACGQEYVLAGGAFFAIRDGKIARVTNYYNLPEWLAQVAPAPQ